MRRRLVIITEIIAPYRIPVFNALAREEGIDLHVIFLAESDPGLRDWLVYKDEVSFSYQVLPSWRRRFGGHNVLLNRGLKRALGQSPPDVILCGGYNYLASWQAQRWARTRRVPFLLWVESTERDIRSHNPIVEFLKKRFMKSCGAFVVPGESSFRYVKNYGTLEDHIFVAPNAVDTAFFAQRAAAVHQDGAGQRQALHLPERFFLFVGRLVAEKGIFDLLKAYSKLTPDLRAAVSLVFVGDGTERASLVRESMRIKGGQVRFAGFIHREQLAGYYALAEVFVFPSHTDTWGLAVNEAMACGLPVISSEVAGCTADLVQEGWNGRVVRRGDVVQLASAMEEIAGDPVLRARMASHSKERILGYSPEGCAAGIARAVLASEMRDHE